MAIYKRMKGVNKIEKQQEIQKENKEKKVLKPTNIKT